MRHTGYLVARARPGELADRGSLENEFAGKTSNGTWVGQRLSGCWLSIDRSFGFGQPRDGCLRYLGRLQAWVNRPNPHRRRPCPFGGEAFAFLGHATARPSDKEQGAEFWPGLAVLSGLACPALRPPSGVPTLIEKQAWHSVSRSFFF